MKDLTIVVGTIGQSIMRSEDSGQNMGSHRTSTWICLRSLSAMCGDESKATQHSLCRYGKRALS